MKKCPFRKVKLDIELCPTGTPEEFADCIRKECMAWDERIEELNCDPRNGYICPCRLMRK